MQAYTQACIPDFTSQLGIDLLLFSSLQLALQSNLGSGRSLPGGLKHMEWKKWGVLVQDEAREVGPLSTQSQGHVNILNLL